jgi:hypothetical protein
MSRLIVHFKNGTTANIPEENYENVRRLLERDIKKVEYVEPKEPVKVKVKEPVQAEPKERKPAIASRKKKTN